MGTEATRELVQKYYDALAKRDKALLAPLLTEDVELQPPESAPKIVGFTSLAIAEPLKGRDAVTAALRGEAVSQVFDVNSFQVKVHRMIVDGDIAVVQHAVSAKTLGGDQYDNEYCWIYHCRDGKIARMEEYVDTLKVARLMKLEV